MPERDPKGEPGTNVFSAGTAGAGPLELLLRRSCLFDGSVRKMPERDAKGFREASTAMPPPALRVITTLSDSSRPAAAGPAGAGSLPEAAVGQPIARLSAATVENTDQAERLPAWRVPIRP